MANRATESCWLQVWRRRRRLSVRNECRSSSAPLPARPRSIDLEKDPYFFKNHLGFFECRLCLTVHQNDASYLAHTQGRKHSTNLARRNARDEQQKDKDKDGGSIGAGFGGVPKKSFITIGTPEYELKKIRDPLTKQLGLSVHITFPQIVPGIEPHYRWLSAYEQHNEEPDINYMWLVIAAEPYKSVAFKISKKDMDSFTDKHYEFWDPDSKNYWLQFIFRSELQQHQANVPGLAPGLTN